MRADIHAPTVRIIQLWHDADVDKARRIAMRKGGLWTRVQHVSTAARPGAINRCIHSTRVSSRPDCCTA